MDKILLEPVAFDKYLQMVGRSEEIFEKPVNPILEKTKSHSITEINHYITIHDNTTVFNSLESTFNILHSKNAESILMLACQYGALGCIQYILDNNVDINYYCKTNNTTALLYITYLSNSTPNREEIARQLILYGADINIKDNNGLNAFENAFKKNQFELVSLFIDMGYDPGQSSIDGINPLIWILKKAPTSLKIDQINHLGKLLVQKGVKLPLEYIDPTTGDNMLHLLAASDNTFIEDVLQRDDIQNNLHRPNNKSQTPFSIAISKNKINNMNLIIKYSKDQSFLNYNSFQFYDLAIKHNADNAFKLLADLKLDTHRNNWLNYIIGQRNITGPCHSFSKNILDALFSMEPIVPNTDLVRSSTSDKCTCNIFPLLVYNNHLNYIKSMLPTYKDVLNTFFCPNHGTLLSICLQGLSNIELGSSFVFLECLLSGGLDPNFKNDKYNYISKCSHLEHVKLLLEYGITINSSITSYKHLFWKTLTIHTKMNLNKVEYLTDQDIYDINDQNFFIFKNGICWDLNNLYNYITSTVKGNNQYDNKSPWPYQQIWKKDDIDNLRRISSNTPKADTIIKYLDIASIYHQLPTDFINLMDDCAQIFWARGPKWDNTIPSVLNEIELKEWYEKVPNIREHTMPAYLSISVNTKLEKLKQEYLHIFHHAYINLDEKLINEVLPTFAPNVFKKNITSDSEIIKKNNGISTVSLIDKAFIGEECIMVTGNYLKQSHTRLTSWKK